MMQMKLILYSTGCPRCNVLKKKLSEKNIAYEEFTDSDQMIDMGIESVPVLSVNGELFDFMQANTWINSYEGE